MTDQSQPGAVNERPNRTALQNVVLTARGSSGMVFLPQSFAEVVTYAEMMSRADVAVPKHLRGNPGACMAVVMRANSWEMDAFAVADKTYSVNDRLAFEAQLVAAVVHTRAPIKRRPDYEFLGEGPTRRCIVSVEMLDGTTKTYESPEFRNIQTKNSPLWKADLDQQLGYFSIRGWGRRHAPEVLLGVYTPDELIDSPALAERAARAAQASGTGVAARLAARETGEGATGFSASHVARETGQTAAEEIGDDIPSQYGGQPAADAEFEEVDRHDPVTGEVLEDETADDGFPGDKPAGEGLGLKTGAQVAEEKAAQASRPLAERVAELKAQCEAEGVTAAQLAALWRKAADLKRDMDNHDPEGFAELEEWFAQLFAKVDDAEKDLALNGPRT